MSATRDALAGFLGALGEIQLFGRPQPRAAAENITALLGELFSIIPIDRPDKTLRGLPVTRIRERASR